MKKIRTQYSCHGCGNNTGKKGKIACKSQFAKKFFGHTKGLMKTQKDLGKNCSCPDVKRPASLR